MAGSRSEGGDEQSDFKTTTLRFTNNNFTIEHNKFQDNRGQSPFLRQFDNHDTNFSQKSHIEDSQRPDDHNEYGLSNLYHKFGKYNMTTKDHD